MNPKTRDIHRTEKFVGETKTGKGLPKQMKHITRDVGFFHYPLPIQHVTNDTSPLNRTPAQSILVAMLISYTLYHSCSIYCSILGY